MKGYFSIFKLRIINGMQYRVAAFAAAIPGTPIMMAVNDPPVQATAHIATMAARATWGGMA